MGVMATPLQAMLKRAHACYSSLASNLPVLIFQHSTGTLEMPRYVSTVDLRCSSCQSHPVWTPPATLPFLLPSWQQIGTGIIHTILWAHGIGVEAVLLTWALVVMFIQIAGKDWSLNSENVCVVVTGEKCAPEDEFDWYLHTASANVAAHTTQQQTRQEIWGKTV